MYELKQKLHNFHWDHPYLFVGVVVFAVMFAVISILTLFFGPIILCGVFECGWPLLLEFITIPTIAIIVKIISDLVD